MAFDIEFVLNKFLVVISMGLSIYLKYKDISTHEINKDAQGVLYKHIYSCSIIITFPSIIYVFNKRDKIFNVTLILNPPVYIWPVTWQMIHATRYNSLQSMMPEKKIIICVINSFTDSNTVTDRMNPNEFTLWQVTQFPFITS